MVALSGTTFDDCAGAVGGDEVAKDRRSEDVKRAADEIASLWRKSSTSGGNGCVEVCLTGAGALIRDSEDPDGPWLRFSPWQWTAFLDAAKRGEFDEGKLDRAGG
jgi:hypothetical protein